MKTIYVHITNNYYKLRSRDTLLYLNSTIKLVIKPYIYISVLPFSRVGATKK